MRELASGVYWFWDSDVLVPRFRKPGSGNHIHWFEDPKTLNPGISVSDSSIECLRPEGSATIDENDRTKHQFYLKL